MQGRYTRKEPTTSNGGASRLMTKSIGVVLVLTMFATGCATAITDCPEPTPIDAETQRKAVEELAKLPPDANINLILAAAMIDRDKLRACRKIR